MFASKLSNVPALMIFKPGRASAVVKIRIPHSGQKLLVTLPPESPKREYCFGVPLHLNWLSGTIIFVLNTLPVVFRHGAQ